MKIRTIIRSLATGLALASVLCLWSGGCDKPGSPGSQAASRGEPTGVYTVRAQVEMVPEPGRPTSAFMVHHEPIDDFINPDKSRGMNSMIMPMPLAPGVAIDRIKVGDIVEITFAAWTGPGNLGLECRAVKKLPADTKLRFGVAAPRLDTPPGSK